MNMHMHMSPWLAMAMAMAMAMIAVRGVAGMRRLSRPMTHPVHQAHCLGQYHEDGTNQLWMPWST